MRSILEARGVPRIILMADPAMIAAAFPFAFGSACHRRRLAHNAMLGCPARFLRRVRPSARGLPGTAYPIRDEEHAMDTDEKLALIAQTIAHQGGQISALTAALLCVLHIARGTPGVREAIEARLEQNYAGLLARSESQQYVAGFEAMRDNITAALKS
jgi:hypothetical protein